jgi:hypothetical protein|nr:MAG TPA: Protein of unknown function (DUF2536) [Caudoviricetes sp.]
MYKMYNYYENVKNDVENYIKENKEYFKATDLEELEKELNEQCWISDSVTGNCSGSYTFNTYEAEKNLNGNWDLLQEALEEFGCSDVNPIKRGAEWCDVTIRCYVLSQAISSLLEQMEENNDPILDEIFGCNTDED